MSSNQESLIRNILTMIIICNYKNPPQIEWSSSLTKVLVAIKEKNDWLNYIYEMVSAFI